MSLVLCTRDIPRKSQAFPKADGRHTIFFKVRGTGLAVYFTCLPARCGKAWVFLPARCGKAWLFLSKLQSRRLHLTTVTFLWPDQRCQILCIFCYFRLPWGNRKVALARATLPIPLYLLQLSCQGRPLRSGILKLPEIFHKKFPRPWVARSCLLLCLGTAWVIFPAHSGKA